MHADRVNDSSELMLLPGMRLIARCDNFTALEMRGGTHRVLTSDAESSLINDSFELMLEDLV